MLRFAFDSFSVVTPPGWEDYTKVDTPPVTLGRGDGVGSLQFSVALYADGDAPDPSPTDLSEMVVAFARARSLGTPREAAVESGPLRLAAGSFTWGEDFLRIWQVSDGRNFAMVTYTCESGQEARELGECERIVRTIEFRAADT